MTDPTFRTIKRLFVQSFKAGDNDPIRNSFNKYYMPGNNLEIKGSIGRYKKGTFLRNMFGSALLGNRGWRGNQTFINIYWFKVNKRKTKTRFEIGPKSKIKLPERRLFIVGY